MGAKTLETPENQDHSNSVTAACASAGLLQSRTATSLTSKQTQAHVGCHGIATTF